MDEPNPFNSFQKSVDSVPLEKFSTHLKHTQFTIDVDVFHISYLKTTPAWKSRCWAAC